MSSAIKISRWYILPVLLIFLWQGVYLIVREPAMSSPLQSGFDLFTNIHLWLKDILFTLQALLISFLISAFMGILIGFFIGLSSFWTQTMNPILLSLYSIPKVAIYPVFLLAFGLTLEGRIAFSVLHGVFPIAIICISATQNVPKIFLKLAQSYRMTFWQKARYILIPSIMPQLVVGLRMAFSLCFLGLILAEMFASYEGIGYRLMHYTSLNRSSYILALFLIIIFIALFFTYLFLLWQEQNERKIGKSNVHFDS
ncbi:ABC transporter permease [Aneurinibacillus tyrosinisolvens]|uniref:ABC transporter permease n=1 Tax=Aneurinibacillus tyrosinisolvens TaxID=1443435 RepID=UPI00069B1E90|nr:ABC transporter permease subunit [Aneurinibacillus tyrosinisolvens]